jgi:hypothetical protein
LKERLQIVLPMALIENFSLRLSLGVLRGRKKKVKEGKGERR